MKRDGLPRRWSDCGIHSDHRDDQHAMLFGHRSAELVRRSRDLARRANISGEDRQNRRDITERDVTTPRETGSDEDCRVGNAIGDFVVKFSYL